MIRTQIQLDEDSYRRLQAAARKRGVSMAEVVRSGVEMAIAQQERRRRWDRAASVLGKYASGRKDVAHEHDRYLAETFRK